jgi:hypothetical protein
MLSFYIITRGLILSLRAYENINQGIVTTQGIATVVAIVILLIITVYIVLNTPY